MQCLYALFTKLHLTGSPQRVNLCLQLLKFAVSWVQLDQHDRQSSSQHVRKQIVPPQVLSGFCRDHGNELSFESSLLESL